MAARTVVITGASDGIGAAAARTLAATGHRVIVVGRSPERTAAIGAELAAPYFVADFADLDQVRRLAAELRREVPRIDVLVNNAGALMGRREITTDGYEKTFQVNHLAPFLLTTELLDLLLTARASVITTASLAHRRAHLNLDDVNLDRGYSAGRAYANSKLANILFSAELDRRHRAQGLSSAALHPGIVASSFGRGSSSLTGLVYASTARFAMTSPDAGAATLIWLAATTPGTDWASGGYYARRRPARASRAARDRGRAEQLWQLSERLVGTR